jgi:hypothetical protein
MQQADRLISQQTLLVYLCGSWFLRMGAIFAYVRASQNFQAFFNYSLFLSSCRALADCRTPSFHYMKLKLHPAA